MGKLMQRLKKKQVTVERFRANRDATRNDLSLRGQVTEQMKFLR